MEEPRASDSAVAIFRIIDEAAEISATLQRAGLFQSTFILGFALWRRTGRPAEFGPGETPMMRAAIAAELRSVAGHWETLEDHALKLAAACLEIKQLVKVNNA